MFRFLRHGGRLIFIALVLLRYDVFCLRKSGLRRGERLAAAFTRLGPSFIKLGQALSTRSDLIGEQMAADLARLRDRLPPFPAHAARAVIEEELGQKLAALFLEFHDEPTAAASIAQVHKAKLANGRDVAVKVLRPGIEKAFARDVELFAWLADLAEEKLPRSRRLKPREVVQTLKESVFFELDLRFEAAAADELAENLRRHAMRMRVPKIIWANTSRRVLVMDWVDGVPFSDMPAIRGRGFAMNDVLENFSASLFTQVFVDGFFHADLHPGNLFLDTKTGELVAVDFGIMGRLSWESRAYIAQIIHGFLNGDYKSVADLHFAAGYVPPHKSKEAFTQACRAVTQPILGRPLSEISVAKLLGQMFAIATEFEMEVQPQLLLMQKTLMVAEGVGRMMNPDVNMWEMTRPLIEQWATEHFSKPARLKMAAEKTREIALKFPGILQNIELSLKNFSDPQGLRLHPDTVRALNEQRHRRHRDWLLFAWAVFAGAAAYLLFS